MNLPVMLPVNRLRLFTAFLLLPLMVQAQSRYLKNYTVNDGLAGNHVYMCHQDRKGHLWIATSSGLSRFDGQQFRNYDFEDGLPNNEVLFVTSDQRNRIWLNIFSSTPSFVVIDHGTVSNYRNSAVLNAMPIDAAFNTSAYSKARRTLYFSGPGNFVCCRDDGKPLVRSRTFVSQHALFQVSDTELFVGAEHYIYSVQDTTLRLLQALAGPEPARSYHWYHNTLYVARSHAIDLYRRKGRGFERFRTVSFPTDILRLYPDRHGLWVCFDNQAGAWLYSDWLLVRPPEKIDIPGIVNYITDDAEGNVWICTVDKGLFFLPVPGMVNHTAHDGLQSSMVTAVCPLSASTCWVGYATGGADLLSLHDGSFTVRQRIRPPGRYSGNNIMIDIACTADSTVYFFTRDRLFSVKDRKLTTVSGHNAGKSFLLINDTLLGLAERLYQVRNLRSGTTVAYRTGRIYAQAADRQQNLWIGGMKGLFYIPAANHYRSGISQVKALRKIKINALACHDPYVWVGTQNNGLFLLCKDSVVAWYTYPRHDVLCSNNILALTLQDSCLWIGTNKGLTCTRFDYNTLRFSQPAKADYQDGLLSPEINKIKILDSTVFIASSGGLVVTRALRPPDMNYTPPDVAVHDLGTGAILRDTEIHVTYSSKGLELTFRTAGFRYGPELVYHYMLTPFDKGWNSTAGNQVRYTNIPPGGYRFLVRVGDSRGNTSHIIQPAHIRIHPLYWQTWWFRLLTGGMIIVLLAAGIYLLMRRSRKRALQKMTVEKLIARSQLVALRAQIKPHFLYNSLNAINDFIYNHRNDEAASLLHGFAGFIRKGFHLADQDYTTIHDEVAFVTRYFELERQKCDCCFAYTIAAGAAIEDTVIPSLITQPFIENAVLHGIRSRIQGGGKIGVTYTANDNDIVCTISDNGIGIRRSLESKKLYHTYSKGLSITRERMTYFKAALGADIRLVVQDLSEEDPAAEGTRVTITFVNGLQHAHQEQHTGSHRG